VEGDRIAYVGESEDVAERLKRHTTVDTKDFWIDTIAFVSKDESLTNVPCWNLLTKPKH
jgi:hypothetical protein